MDRIYIGVEDENDVIKNVCSEIAEASMEAINSKGVFFVGFSGGSLINYLCAGLPEIKADFSKWKIFFCDERYVPVDDNESIFGAYKRDLLLKVPIKEEQFVTINQDISLEECALDYEKKIRIEFSKFVENTCSTPEFDLLLLGMGPDGHTCSLFPGHTLIKETNKLIAPIDDSPKPPSKRITMTYPLLNNAKCCIFALSGSGKSDIIKKVFKENSELPAALVSPKVLKVIFDKDAGKSFGVN